MGTCTAGEHGTLKELIFRTIYQKMKKPSFLSRHLSKNMLGIPVLKESVACERDINNDFELQRRTFGN